MISADLAVLVVLISVGALIGKVNPLQLLIIAMLETIFFAVNEYICYQLLKAIDFGRSVEVHLFGALFGIAVSRMIFNRKICTSRALATSYKSEMYAMIGKSIIKMLCWFWNQEKAMCPIGVYNGVINVRSENSESWTTRRVTFFTVDPF